MNQTFRFPRSQRLRTKTEFSNLFEKGNSFSKYPVKTVYAFEKTDKVSCKFAVTVSKRNFKHAVKRNRIKRLLREACRLHKHELESLCLKEGYSIHVLFIYQNNKLPDYSLIADKIVHSLSKLSQICQELAREETDC